MKRNIYTYYELSSKQKEIALKEVCEVMNLAYEDTLCSVEKEDLEIESELLFKVNDEKVLENAKKNYMYCFKDNDLVIMEEK